MGSHHIDLHHSYIPFRETRLRPKIMKIKHFFSKRCGFFVCFDFGFSLLLFCFVFKLNIIE